MIGTVRRVYAAHAIILGPRNREYCAVAADVEAFARLAVGQVVTFTETETRARHVRQVDATPIWNDGAA